MALMGVFSMGTVAVLDSEADGAFYSGKPGFSWHYVSTVLYNIVLNII